MESGQKKQSGRTEHQQFGAGINDAVLVLRHTLVHPTIRKVQRGDGEGAVLYLHSAL